MAVHKHVGEQHKVELLVLQAAALFEHAALQHAAPVADRERLRVEQSQAFALLSPQLLRERVLVLNCEQGFAREKKVSHGSKYVSVLYPTHLLVEFEERLMPHTLAARGINMRRRVRHLALRLSQCGIVRVCHPRRCCELRDNSE